jgi:hypothetical protein
MLCLSSDLKTSAARRQCRSARSLINVSCVRRKRNSRGGLSATPPHSAPFPPQVCHAVLPKGGRCNKEAKTKSAYCGEHVYLDDPSGASHAASAAPATPPKAAS